MNVESFDDGSGSARLGAVIADVLAEECAKSPDVDVFFRRRVVKLLTGGDGMETMEELGALTRVEMNIHLLGPGFPMISTGREGPV